MVVARRRSDTSAAFLGRARVGFVPDCQSPRGGVSYYEAEAYAAFVGARLPTAAEWEKAATGSVARKYPWGDEWRDDACGMRGLALARRYRSASSRRGAALLALAIWSAASGNGARILS